MNVMKRILAITLTVMSISSYAGGRGCARCHGGACSRKSAPAARQSCPNGVCHRQPAPQAQSGCSNGGGFRAMYFAAKKAETEAKQKTAQAAAAQQRQEDADLAEAIANSLKEQKVADAPQAPVASITRTVSIEDGDSVSSSSYGSGSGSDSASRLSDDTDAETAAAIALSQQPGDAPAPQASQGLLASFTRIFTSQQKPVTPAAPAETPAAAPQAQAPVKAAAPVLAPQESVAPGAAPAPEKPADMLNTLPSITDPVVQTLNADATEASKILNFFTCDQDKLVFMKWFNTAVDKRNYNELYALINTLMEGNKEAFKTAVRNIMGLPQDTAIAEDQLIDYVFELIQSNGNNQAIRELITKVYGMDHNFPINTGLWASQQTLSGLLSKWEKQLTICDRISQGKEMSRDTWQKLTPLHKLYYIELLAAYCAVMNQLPEVTKTK